MYPKLQETKHLNKLHLRYIFGLFSVRKPQKENRCQFRKQRKPGKLLNTYYKKTQRKYYQQNSAKISNEIQKFEKSSIKFLRCHEIT